MRYPQGNNLKTPKGLGCASLAFVHLLKRSVAGVCVEHIEKRLLSVTVDSTNDHQRLLQHAVLSEFAPHLVFVHT